MNKSIAIMILSSPTSNSSAQNALSFAKAVLDSGNSIYRLFFFHEGVNHASNLTVYSQDEINLPAAWQDFIRENKLDAVFCISSALKRGVINKPEASRYEKQGSNIASDMPIAGLGEWIEAITHADKHIVFGN